MTRNISVSALRVAGPNETKSQIKTALQERLELIDTLKTQLDAALECGDLCIIAEVQTRLDMELLRIPMVGTPCTYVIGEDEYPATVEVVSRTGINVRVRLGELRGDHIFVPYDDVPGAYNGFTTRRFRRGADGFYHLRSGVGFLVLGVRAENIHAA